MRGTMNPQPQGLEAIGSDVNTNIPKRAGIAGLAAFISLAVCLPPVRRVTGNNGELKRQSKAAGGSGASPDTAFHITLY